MRIPLRNQRGQTMVEYLLLTAVIMTLVVVMFRLFSARELIYGRITRPIVAYLKYSYKYGDRKALGWDEGNPKNHIQISEPNRGQTFKIFITEGER